MIEDCFQCQEITVSYDFIRRDISLIINNDALYAEFFDSFIEYFLGITLTRHLQVWANRILNHSTISQENKKKLKNTLRRIFSDDDHYKGLIGEYILGFYYNYINNDFLYDFGPKVRSSAEPGIDYIVFFGREGELESIKFIVWETKTTDNTPSSRASEIYDFFRPNGSFDENIDFEINSIQAIFEGREESNLKTVVVDMSRQVVERNNKLNIGACLVLLENRTRRDTLREFENCLPELTREQRHVLLIFFELRDRVMEDLKVKLWNRL